MRKRSALLTLALLPATASRLAAQYDETSVVQFMSSSLGQPSDLYGWSVAGIGDVNHDGQLDLAVGAPFTPDGRHSSAGRVYAVSGANGHVLWQRTELNTSHILGYSLETMDWNADGVLDVVAAAPFAGSGRVWVFSGVDGSTLAQLIGAAGGAGFGASLATNGDFDGDGTPDLLVGAPPTNTAAGTEAGRVYVFARGASTPWTTIEGPYASAQFGTGLAYAGNTTPAADGRSEIVVGYRDATSFFDGFCDVYEWNGSAAALRYTVGGTGMGYMLMGNRMDGGRDVDGDGLDDFLVGDMFRSQVGVHSGADGALLRTLDGAGEQGGFGAVRFLHDIDGDGRSDIVVGAWRNSAGADEGGKVFVYSGASGALLNTITSTTDQFRLGIDARELGDFNGDGKLDLVVGAYGGTALVFSGHVPAPQNSPRGAQLFGDPRLDDVGGDPTAGPIAGSPLEVFNLALDCSGAPASGPYTMRVRLTFFASPVVTAHGWSWIGGPLLLQKSGLQTRSVVTWSPSGLIVPADPALVGLSYGAQGSCGGRLSSALRQTIGR